MKHLLSSAELSLDEIRYCFQVAKAFVPWTEKARPQESLPLLQGKTIAHLFFENSTRTRMSFELAARKLGAQVLQFNPSTSSLHKGETLLDTAKNIAAFGVHALIVRHACAGVPLFFSQNLDLPIVNAGDGMHEHPTQGLLDAFTLEQNIGSLTQKHIVILGDVVHSRVAKSNIHILKKLGAQVTLCGPPTFLPDLLKQMDIAFSYELDSLLPTADAIITLRIQRERQVAGYLPSLSEYAKLWGLNAKRASRLKPEAVILHPGPVQRGIELESACIDGPRSLILKQVSSGIAIRMAILSQLCHPTALNQWMQLHAAGGYA